MKRGGLIYSTNTDLDLNPIEENNNCQKNDFILEVFFEKKGRKGKGVTIIKNFQGNAVELALLAKQMKTVLGIGGSIKNNEIILQGRLQDKAIIILQKNGYKTKKVGG